MGSERPILTPVTYLNYFTPENGRLYETARNIFLAVVGAGVMELVESIPGDILLFKMGINPALIAYTLSRPAAVGFALLAVISKSPNFGNCEALELAEFACCFVAMSTSSYLFLRRVQAVWKGNRVVSIVFSLLWLAGLAFDALLFDVTRAGPLADTGYCVIASVKHNWGAGAPITSLVFDTLVFLAISYKIATDYQVTPGGQVVAHISFATLLSGKALPRFSRSVLKGGQQYYLFAVMANLVLVVFMTLPLSSPQMKTLPTPLAIAVTSIVACRVYRNLRLESLKATEFFDTSKFMVASPGTDRSDGVVTQSTDIPYSGHTFESANTRRSLGDSAHEPTVVVLGSMTPDFCITKRVACNGGSTLTAAVCQYAKVDLTNYNESSCD